MGVGFQFEQHRLGLWDLKKTVSWEMGLGPPPPPLHNPRFRLVRCLLQQKLVSSLKSSPRNIRSDKLSQVCWTNTMESFPKSCILTCLSQFTIWRNLNHRSTEWDEITLGTCFSGALAARRVTKRSPILISERKGNPWIDFLIVVTVSCISLRSVRTTVAVTTESCKTAAILQLIGFKNGTVKFFLIIEFWQAGWDVTFGKV